MRRIRSPKVWIPLSIILLLLAGLAVPALARHSFRQASLCSKQAFASGIIVRIDTGKNQSNPKGDSARALRLHDPTQASDPSLAGVNLVVGVTDATRIFRQQGSEYNPASFSDLKAGQKVAVWSKSGTALNSYPGQIRDTSDIVIVA
jgi:type II secretory pathway pseudopilin PulG